MVVSRVLQFESHADKQNNAHALLTQKKKEEATWGRGNDLK